jgi:hypothetical protein
MTNTNDMFSTNRSTYRYVRLSVVWIADPQLCVRNQCIFSTQNDCRTASNAQKVVRPNPPQPTSTLPRELICMHPWRSLEYSSPCTSLMSSVLLSFCAAAFLFSLVRTWWRRRRLLPGLAVPQAASLVWGHEKDIFEAETGTKYTTWANELGPTYKIKSPWLVGAILFDWISRSQL